MYTPNRTSSKVTFVENLPDMDELIENYEQSSNQPMQPPPKRSGAYTLYENIYGGGMESKSMGMRTKFEDESANKDILLNKALQKLPTRFTSEINGSSSSSGGDSHNHREVEEQPKMFVQEHHHNRPYVIYENNHLPSYTLPPPHSPPPPSHFSSYQHNYPPHPPPPPLRQSRPRPPPKKRPPVKQQQKEIHSLCSMINSHISSCSLCNNLYISTLKSKCKPQKRNMSTVAFVIVILILITVCFLLMKRVWNLTPTAGS